MGSLVAFPAMTAQRAPAVEDAPPALPATGGRRGEYALADVARELRLLHFRQVRTIIDKLRALAAHAGMPLPSTPRIVNGLEVRGPGAIYLHSRWDAGTFDAWLDGRGPGAPAAPRPVPPAIVVEMARRASALAVAASA